MKSLEPNTNFLNEGPAEFIPSELLKKVLDKPEPEERAFDTGYNIEFKIAFDPNRLKPLEVLKGGEIVITENNN